MRVRGGHMQETLLKSCTVAPLYTAACVCVKDTTDGSRTLHAPAVPAHGARSSHLPLPPLLQMPRLAVQESRRQTIARARGGIRVPRSTRLRLLQESLVYQTESNWVCLVAIIVIGDRVCPAFSSYLEREKKSKQSAQNYNKIKRGLGKWDSRCK